MKKRPTSFNENIAASMGSIRNMSIPDTNPVDIEALREAIGIDAWGRLEAVVAASLYAAAKGDISPADAESVIKAGIMQAREALIPTPGQISGPSVGGFTVK